MAKNPDPRKDKEFKAVVERMLKTPPKPFTPKQEKQTETPKKPTR
jgi:hypothetical protein